MLANLLFLIGMLWFRPLEGDLNVGVALLVFIAVMWFSEAMHITLTALSIPILCVVLGVFDTKTALSQFSHPIIFLFLGGFALASALRCQGLDKALADAILKWSGGKAVYAVFLMLICVAVLSMWISNTATTAMMLPVMLGLLGQFDTGSEGESDDAGRRRQRFCLLALAYCASMGGMATVIGSPPNAIAAAQLGMSFLDWMLFASPLLAILLPTSLVLLWLIIRPTFPKAITTQVTRFEWTRSRILTASVFAVTVAGWLMSKLIAGWLQVSSVDTLIAMIALVSLGLLKLMDWKSFQSQTDWGVLLLFGGGLTLSAALQATGTSAFLAQWFASLFNEMPLLVMFIGLATFVVFLTEMASNTASAALLVPLFASLAAQLGLPEQSLVVMVGMACSCAFMLPVATPPNAIVFGSGKLEMKDFIRHGLALNILSSILLGTYAWLNL
ncbi:DASS family sodium-coupled anion symporter [Corallincola platygyrae]